MKIDADGECRCSGDKKKKKGRKGLNRKSPCYFLVVAHSRLVSLIAAMQQQHNVWPAAVVSRTV